jgi:PAS domain S-box-containing protein
MSKIGHVFSPRACATGKSAKAGLWASCLLGILVVGFIDLVTGSEFGLSPLYVVFVAIIAWGGNRNAGILISLFAAIVWSAADIFTRDYTYPAIAFWNGGMRLIMFLTVALLLSHLRYLNGVLEKNVVEKSLALTVEVDRHESTRKALWNSDEQLRTLIESVQDYAIFMLDAGGHIVSWNRGAERLTGYSPEEILQKHFSLLWPAEEVSQEMAREALAKALREGTLACEGWRVRRDGSLFWASTILTVLRDPAGNIQGVSKVVQNVSERKVLEDRLLAKEENERRRIGHDLHDTLGQDFTALALLSKELEEKLQTEGMPEAILAGKISRYANEAIQRTRHLARGLYPFGIQSDGLAAAMRELTLAAKELLDVDCEFICPRPMEPSSSMEVLHIYRIVQEAVTNAVRHGKAKKIRILSIQENNRFVLRIEDDGCGMKLPSEPPQEGGMGMSIIKYRVRILGGDVAWEPLQPHGTAVVCSLPALSLKPPEVEN